jgi:hypothetical protein
VAEALTVYRALRLAITLATCALASLVAAHTVGAEVRGALVVDATRVTVVLLRVALTSDAARSVLTVVARDALGVVAALLLTIWAVTHMAVTEHIVVIDACTRAVTRVVRVVVAAGAALRHADRAWIVEVAGAATVT